LFVEYRLCFKIADGKTEDSKLYVMKLSLNSVSFFLNVILICNYFPNVDWHSSVGIATRYGLDDPVIESRYGRDLLAL
jgi:hypothetical protein